MISKIEIWGDSILKGIVLSPELRYTPLGQNGCIALAAAKLQTPVENHSRFGMTSEKGLKVVERGVEKLEDRNAVLLCFGGNDTDYNWQEVASFPEQKHLPHTVPKRFEENINKMIETISSHGQVPVLCTLPAIDAVKYFAWITRAVTSPENIIKFLGDVQQIFRSHQLYNSIVEKTAKKLSCHLIDLRGALMKSGAYTDFLCADGIHPNARGHRIMADTLLNYANCNI